MMKTEQIKDSGQFLAVLEDFENVFPRLSSRVSLIDYAKKTVKYGNVFVVYNGENGDLLIQKAPACTIETQAQAVTELFGGNKEDIRIIGIHHGEKMYETLLTNEECAKAVDMGEFYRVPADNRGLNYDKYFKEGDEKRNTLTEFNSNNTRRLNLAETKEKIASLEYIKEELASIEK